MLIGFLAGSQIYPKTMVNIVNIQMLALLSANSE